MASKIHNVAVVGHGTCGKTTLIEELLARAKSIGRAGKVDDGTSVLDHDAEEKERGFTIDASVGCIEAGGSRLYLIDTPGYPDFLGAAVDALSAVETAVIAVDASAGIRVNTRRAWEEAGRLHVGRMILITRMDAEHADFEARVAEIQDAFGQQCLPLIIPNASGAGFSSVENTYHLKGESSSGQAKELHAQITEAIVEADEDLMERYLAEEKISDEEIDAAFPKAVLAGTIIPIIPVSAVKGVGLDELQETLLHLAPPADSPIEHPVVDSHGEPIDAKLIGDASSPFVARVFKVVSDPFVGKLSYLRIYSGTAKPNLHVVDRNEGSKERLTSLLRCQGKEQTQVDSAGPGDIVAVPKLDSVQIGDTIAESAGDPRFAPVRHPQSMVKLAVEPKNRNDETKIWEALVKLSEGDSNFKAERIAQTHELVISGRSSLHLEVMLSRLKRRFELEVDTHIPKTSYLESISGSSEAHHRHKKQTGGRGQFGEVYIRLAKAEKGAGLVFHDKIVGGSIPNQFIPAVEKGIRETMDQGILAGCPIVDCEVTLYDGSFHPVDSSEAAFKTAGREAFKKAFMAAKPCLLEPMVKIEIHVPTQFMGDIMSDLNSRRGQIGGMDAEGDHQIIRAVVPESEVKRYSTELRSLTGGEGSYTIEFSHYDIVPAHAQAEIIKEMEKAEAS